MMPGTVRWLDAVGSTQDTAHEMAGLGAPHGAAVAARVQTAGRGTRRRIWVSSEGGLWLSVICRPRDLPHVEAVGLRIALAVVALIDRWVEPGHRVEIKWPNDIYLDGRKAGGVLAEARWQGETLAWLVVGIGLNVRNPLPAHTEAARLQDAGARQTPEALAPAVAIAIAEATRNAGPLTAQELRMFEARDWLRGRRLRFPVVGTAVGVSDSGRLRIRTPEGMFQETLETVVLAEGPS
jgi:biotin-[acetyl-CoA-carboxylase] ligase BirA-like protein